MSCTSRALRFRTLCACSIVVLAAACGDDSTPPPPDGGGADASMDARVPITDASMDAIAPLDDGAPESGITDASPLDAPLLPVDGGCTSGVCSTTSWVHPIGGSGSEAATSVAIDGAGNVFVGGRFEGMLDFGGGVRTSAGRGDGFVAKYGPGGAYLWDHPLSGDGLNADGVTAVAVDASGNVIVAGYFQGGLDFGGGIRRTGMFAADGFVASYGPGGEYRWDRTYGTLTGVEQSSTVAVDGASNVYVSGQFYVGGTDFGGGSRSSLGMWDGFVASYASGGAYRWDRAFGTTGYDSANVAVDAAGGYWVAGGFEGAIDFGGGPRTSAGAWDAFVVRFTAAHGYAWDHTIGTAAQDEAIVAADLSGNAIVAGQFDGTIDVGGGARTTRGMSDIFVVGYAPDGGYRWDRSFGGRDTDAVRAVVANGDQAIVAGYFQLVADFGDGGSLSGGFWDAFVAAYAADGGYLWHRTFGGAGFDAAGAIVRDGAGGLVVAGSFEQTVDFGRGPTTAVAGTDAFVLRLECGCP